MRTRDGNALHTPCWLEGDTKMRVHMVGEARRGTILARVPVDSLGTGRRFFRCLCVSRVYL